MPCTRFSTSSSCWSWRRAELLRHLFAECLPKAYLNLQRRPLFLLVWRGLSFDYAPPTTKSDLFYHGFWGAGLTLAFTSLDYLGFNQP